MFCWSVSSFKEKTQKIDQTLNVFIFCFLWKLETVGKYSSSYFAKFNTSIVSALNTYSYIVNLYVCVFVYVCVTLTMCG